MPPREITAISVVPPPISTIMLPQGFVISTPGPDCRGYGFLHNCHLPGSRLIGGLFHSSAFHIRHTAGHTDDNSGLSEASSSHGFLNEIPKHLLCDHIVRDHALAQRPDCHDIAGSPADHLTCFFAYGLYFI